MQCMPFVLQQWHSGLGLFSTSTSIFVSNAGKMHADFHMAPFFQFVDDVAHN